MNRKIAHFIKTPNTIPKAGFNVLVEILNKQYSMPLFNLSQSAIPGLYKGCRYKKNTFK